MDRRISLLAVTFCMLVCSYTVHGQRSVLLVNGTAHIGNGKVIEKSAIGIEKGKIKQVYNANIVDPALLKYDTVIDVSGKHIYPGFIAPNTTLGLEEIEAVRATRDFNEVGDLNPNVRALIAYNAESKVTATVRSNGVLMAQIVPRGGVISGTSSIVKLDGWNWEDAAYRADDGIHLNWPRPVNRTDEKAKEQEKKRNDQLIDLGTFFDEARAYLKATYQYERNLKYEAMKGLFDGSKRLFIHVDYMREISEAIYFTRRYNLENITIVGGYDAWKIPELLKDNHVSVILRRVHSLPAREDDDIDLPFKIPALLRKEGILFCLDVSGEMENMKSRNLAFYAGTASAYGLGDELAIQSVTLNAARILGIDSTTGSLEEGKDATLFVSAGNVLDMRTSQVEIAFIKGVTVNLDNHQEELYRRYSNKYKK